METKITKVEENKELNKRTWLDLSEEEIAKLSSKTACMYGKKSKQPSSEFN